MRCARPRCSPRGFLLLGIGDLVVDLVWIACALWRLAFARGKTLCADELPPPEKPGALAVFVPAWDEAAVIRTMLRHTLGTFEHHNYVIYVGCYPNDRATIREVRRIGDEGVSRIDVGPQASVRLPGDVTLAVDWRVRVAGDASPRSGPALTLSTDF